MKRVCILLVLLVFLVGCTGSQDTMEPMLQLRSKLLKGSCSFDAVITADYGNQTYTFAMGCQSDAHGNLSFQVQQPESISGISGTIQEGKGQIHFDSTALGFELLADGQLSPISAPWVLMRAMRSGYIAASGAQQDYIRVTLHDSFEADALTVELWLGEEEIPQQAEIIYKDRRILTVEVKNFVIS